MTIKINISCIKANLPFTCQVVKNVHKVYIMYPFWNLVRMDDNTRSKHRLEKCTQKQKQHTVYQKSQKANLCR